MVDYRNRRAAGSGMMRLEGSEVIDLERAKNNGYEQGKKTLADALTIEMVLAYDGNIADLIEPSDLKAIGKRVVDEYRIDEAARSEWLAGAKSALAAAGQKKGDKKTWPFENSANVKYPLLTTASIQFAARAYPAIVRGDEAVDVKVNGQDLDGKKAARAARVSAYTNDQLMYQCKEWEPGKDALLHQLPIIGAGFTKSYWDEALKRPRIDYASAMKVVMPADSPSMELAPRITHILDTIYPIDYERKVRERVWHKCTHAKAGEDSQKPMCFLEQCRYEDLDGDGLSEPYIVTVFQETAEVVRIDPAFDTEDVIYDAPLDLGADEETGEGYSDDSAEEGEEQPDGRRVLKINRLLPWTDYTFLPDPNGGVYGIGFGRLLEAISETVNSLINQCLDAGTWSNTVTGIAGVGIHTRGGTITLEPNVIKTIAGLTDPDKAIKLLQHPGPNPVSFQLIDMLLEAAKDITSVKDVLTGDNPNSGTPATSTLALIEQGLQVFTSIYKRIYRSMTREFETLCRLNARYLDPADYQKFLDEQPPMPTGPAAQGPGAGIGDNGGPPLTPQDMGAGAPPMVPQGPVPSGQPPMPMAGPPQAPAPGTPPGMAMQPGMAPPAPPVQANPQEDFDLSDMDIRPVADPTAVTEMQRMAKAQALLQLTQNPGAPLNIVEIYKYVLQSMRLPKADAFLMERNPAVEKQAMLAEQKATGEAQAAQANAALLAANAQKAQADAVNAEQSIPLKQQELALKSRELDQKDVELNISAQQLALDQYRADIDAADREMKMIHDKVKAAEDADLQRGNLAIQAKKADNEAARMRASGASNGKSN